MAVLEQERHVELVPGANEAFFVTNRMVSAILPDQLPHLNVFVYAVSDVLDPTADTFSRVANIADLTTVPIGRDPGIAAPGPNGIEYLSNSSTSTYETLETANDAATAYQDRVNALIEGWVSFRTNFNAPDPTPALYTFPRVDPSQKTALISAYAAAKQDRYQKQLTKTEADAALVRAQSDYTYKQGLVTGIAALVAETTAVLANTNATVTQFGALLLAGNTFYGLNSGGPGALAFLAALSLATTQQAAMPGYVSSAQAAVTDSGIYQAARNADAGTSSVALTAAQSDQITKAQLLTSATALEATALAAVLAVCPDFDPTSIPYVPG